MKREISNKSLQMDALDGLRGFAALIVIFSHTSNVGMQYLPMLDLSGIGKSGVFLFFLLSSFLLTLQLLKKGSDIFTVGTMSHYWQRRFFRIYPLFTLYLLSALLTPYLIFQLLGRSDTGVPFHLTLQEFIGHMTLQEGKSVTWSIAVEFKFYFILPFLAFITYLCRDKFGFIGAVLLIIA
ncbi:MAG: acyltransferase family protein, partial [Colwellia sp.]